MSQRKMIEINHALSGIHGPQLKSSAQRVTDARKQIVRRLQRKKKLASVIQDELYWYLEKFPEEKEGLHQEAVKKRKNKVVQDMEDINRLTHKCPVVEVVRQQYLLKDQNTKDKIQQKFSKWFANPIDIQEILMDEERTQ